MVVQGGTRIQRCFAACGTDRCGSCSAERQQQGAERAQPSPCARARAAARQEGRGVAVLGVLQLVITAAADLLGSLQASIAPQLAWESCRASCGMLL